MIIGTLNRHLGLLPVPMQFERIYLIFVAQAKPFFLYFKLSTFYKHYVRIWLRPFCSPWGQRNELFPVFAVMCKVAKHREPDIVGMHSRTSIPFCTTLKLLATFIVYDERIPSQVVCEFLFVTPTGCFKSKRKFKEENLGCSTSKIYLWPNLKQVSGMIACDST